MRTYANLMLVFILCGLWHGAAWHWFVYGAYNGVLMSLHRAFDRQYPDALWRKSPLWVFAAWSMTLFQLLFGLVLIRMTDWTSGGLIMRSLLGVPHDGTAASPMTPLVGVLMVLGMLGHAGPLLPRLATLPGRLAEWLADASRGLVYASQAVALVTLAPGVSKSFIYIAF